jgi:hypothetical protein
MNAAINAKIAAIAPKTILTQLPVIKALRTTQTPREQIARLNHFMVITSSKFYMPELLPWQRYTL